jgi:ketosteroid isomerase-like protein
MPEGEDLAMRIALYAALVLVLAASAAKADDLQSAETLNATLAASFNSGDSARLAGSYKGDAVLCPPGSPLVKGTSGIEHYYRAALKSIADTKFTATEAKAVGDAELIEVGTFTAKTTGQHPRPVAGKFMIEWQKVGSDWRIAADIWNLDR